MKNVVLRYFTVLVTSWCLLTTGFTVPAHAAVVGTELGISAGQRTEHVREVQAWLAKDDVRKQLVQMGVDPTDARSRVAMMTDDELYALKGRIDRLPAGAGALEVIGIVFLVLLILELVGVTHIFSGF